MSSLNQIKKKNKFTQISNICIYDEKLSLDAKGLMCMLCSFPNEWKFYNTLIAKKCGTSLDKLNKLYRMLEEKGYLKRTKKRDEKGKFRGFEFELCDEGTLKPTITEKTTTEKTPLRINPLMDKTTTEKSEAINTNININTKKENNTLSDNVERENFSNFKSFKEFCIKNHEKVSFNIPISIDNLLPNTKIKITPSGYLHNINTGKDFEKEKAFKIWEFMFERKEKIIELIMKGNLKNV